MRKSKSKNKRVEGEWKVNSQRSREMISETKLGERMWQGDALCRENRDVKTQLKDHDSGRRHELCSRTRERRLLTLDWRYQASD